MPDEEKVVYPVNEQNMSDYAVREFLHTAVAVALTVLVAVAAQLVGIGSFEDISVAGLAVTAVRTAATAIVTVGSKYMINRGSN